MPSNIKKFLYDYKYSKFLECNYKLAKKLKEKQGANYTENKERNVKILTGLRKFNEVMNDLYIPYTLFGGTLLGYVVSILYYHFIILNDLIIDGIEVYIHYYYYFQYII